MSQAGQWPLGVTVSASSTHEPNLAPECAYCLRTYEPSNVLDSNTTTFWNDDTRGVYPDNVTISLQTGTEVDLTGLFIASYAPGYIVDFDVSVLRNRTWVRTHQIRGASLPETRLNFTGIPSLSDGNGSIKKVGGVFINVLNSMNEFSRITEVQPIYSTLSSASNSTSTGLPTTDKTSDGAPNRGLLIGISVAVVVATLLLCAASWWCFLIRRRRRRQWDPSRSRSQILRDETRMSDKYMVEPAQELHSKNARVEIGPDEKSSAAELPGPERRPWDEKELPVPGSPQELHSDPVRHSKVNMYGKGS